MFKHFEQIFLEVLNTHAPIKTILLSANNVPLYDKGTKESNYEKVRT